ncbi:MAG: molybdate ABC transporter permease subunit [Merismopediaceae bacterium]|nr:molybdate ABC transporter permease subunit [Merismopediaceae bacterium]
MNLDLSPLWISIKIATIATLITFFLGLMAARLMLDFRGKFKNIIDTIFIAPLVLPPTVVGFLLLLLLGKNSPIGQTLHSIGIHLIFTWQAAVISAIAVSFPLMYRTSLGAFEQIEPNIIAAARTLGGSEWIIFGKMMIPLAYRGIIAATILSFARALGEFGATLMLAGNIPGQTQTMPLAIFFASESGDYQNALIWVLILLSISLSVIIIVNFWAESKQNQYSFNRSLKRKKTQSPPIITNLLPPFLRGAGGINLSQIKQSFLKGAERINSSQIKQSFLRGDGEINSSQIKQSFLQSGDINPKHYSQNFDGLFLDIQKKYTGFNLDIALENELEPLGLLGASGSGKSMTLRCIAGLETPDRGLITVNGQIWFDAKQKINLAPCQRKVGFVFQNYALFPHLTVRENIAFGVQNLSPQEQQRRIDLKIAQMHLQDLEDRYPNQLSGGQQQRVALARALVIEPEILLLDEPFSALDTQLRSQMEKNLLEILSIYPGIVLMVSHNLEEVYRICQNILVISEGKVLSYGDKEQIFQEPHLYEIARLTGCKNFSAIRRLSNHQVQALDWHCELTLHQTIPKTATHVGIRAHQLLFEELETLKKTPTPYITHHSSPFPVPSENARLLESTASPFSQTLEHPSLNYFPCWLVQSSETPHRVTLYLKMNSPPDHYQDYHLQMELFKENWQLLKQFPFPWHLRLDPNRLFVLEKS